MLTEKQQAIFDFINESVASNGFPPSIREIGKHFGVYPATVQDHISALERKGFLQKKRFQSRSLSVPASSRRAVTSDAPGIPEGGIPIVGRVAAGLPLLATENVEEMIHLPTDGAPAAAFLLKVAGDSMMNAHILDGDYVLVHPQTSATNGDIVVALIGEEATVKRFYQTKKGVTLKAENPRFDPIEVEGDAEVSFRLIGRVMGVLRVMNK